MENLEEYIKKNMRMKSIKHRDDFAQWVGHNTAQVEDPYFSIRGISGTILLCLKRRPLQDQYSGVS